MRFSEGQPHAGVIFCGELNYCDLSIIVCIFSDVITNYKVLAHCQSCNLKVCIKIA